MAFSSVVRELVIKLRFAVDDGMVDRANQKIAMMQTKMAKLGSMSKIHQAGHNVTRTAFRIGAAFTAATAGLAFFLNEAGQFNKTRIAFETMAGSVEKGQALLEELHGFALKTPFSIQDVETNAAMLLGMGIEIEKVIPTMKALGDVASGINRPLGMVALNFGQIKTRGVLMGTELRDFARQGVPIIEQLAKQLNKTGAEIQEMTTKRQISFEDVEKAFMAMTSEGGRFNDLMFKQAKTWPVMIANFLIQMRFLAREVGQALLPEAKKFLQTLRDWIFLNKEMLKTNLIRFFKQILDMIKRIGKFIHDIIPRFKDLINAFGGLEKVIKGVTIAFMALLGLQVAKLVGSLVLGIGSLVAAMLGVVPAAVAMNAAMGFLPIIIGLAVIAIAALASEIHAFFKGQDTLIGDLIDRWSDWKTAVKDVLKLLIDFSPPLWIPQLVSLLTTGKTLRKNVQDSGLLRNEAAEAFAAHRKMTAEKLAQQDLAASNVAPADSAQFLNLARQFWMDQLISEQGIPDLDSRVGAITNNIAQRNPVNIKQENNFNIDGAQDTVAVQDAVVEGMEGAIKDLMVNAASDRAVEVTGP
jgi:tape measure domain-containing protein